MSRAILIKGKREVIVLEPSDNERRSRTHVDVVLPIHGNETKAHVLRVRRGSLRFEGAPNP